MSREIVIDADNIRHVVSAVANYRTGRDRIEDTILTIADHIRNGKRHIVDSLSTGNIGQWKADDAMFEELVTQVLVAVQIVLEHKSDIKYKMIEAAECDARTLAVEAFERDKAKLVHESQQAWLEFMDWKREQEKKSKSKKGGAK